ATVVSGQKQDRQGGERRRSQLDRDQCAYCKEKGHWAKDCPKKPRGPRGPRPQTSLL
nr:p10 NC [Moloney murine leukemia virus]1U6P_A Chain A, Gag polyprotein [Moloney murine leukemia virus]1WWD_A Chain A, Nucleoprotein p10 [Moloney murine leukemia virus]1WWE_A Chain A, Nucleoprotein p10 [Moloney murine leukemia virus]1WWF_A Chain A, Nucleoprotein p10 [Moloney murine leukemia virus]1WWG_A Chain A, Nucleoprotein p10 [Moloney murine leukemia virus]2MQV_A Chain A, Nucleocapsid protein p10 [Murine leukemia virus]2MS0_A Chain A, Nucleocapsid protein p10 [Murine leukemia virus]2MS